MPDAMSPDDVAGFSPWRIVAQDHLNPVGAERIFRVGLAPSGSVPLAWRAGDLAEFELPDGQRRTYSISSIPAEGRLDLLVREVRAADGTLGRGTAWLLHEAQKEDSIRIRIKPHAPFHAPANNAPLLLVGAGSGLAGLRPHVLEGATAGRAVWLIYGERHSDRDSRLCRELQAWHQSGTLYRFNTAFSSSSDGDGRYVQDVITQYATDIRHYMGAEGSVMTCGSRTMGQAVEDALRQVLGQAWLDAAQAEVRFRRALF